MIHYVSDLYERNLGYGRNQQNRETRYYCAQLGTEHRLLGFRTRARGTDAPLTIIGTDHHGGTIAIASGVTGTPITGRVRYTPFGEARDATGDFGTDRSFTGQTADAVAGLHWYRFRYYDPAIGRFVQPDTVVPQPSNPQALNRYAYGLNNPLKYTDPTGHARADWDQQWVAEFTQAHGGEPNAQDWADRQFSLENPGTGSNGTWTAADWETYKVVREILGPELLAQIGQSGGAGTTVNTIGGNLWFGTGRTNSLPPRMDGPDGTTIFFNARVYPGSGATTVGNAIYISGALMEQLRNGSPADAKALIAHEYTHVLQYRVEGLAYLPDYNSAARAAALSGHDRGSPFNSYELPAYTIQHIYEQNPWLPGPWAFPVAR